MALTYSSSSKTASQRGAEAPSFELRGVDGKVYSLAQFRESKALIVIFMCNHCPYVIAVQGRINALAREFASRGVSLIGINSNDPVEYPADRFEAMQERAREQNFTFPYLLDENQKAARDYDAACTPDPYVYENVGGKFILRYHGRIDDSWKEEAKVTRRELADAVETILAGRGTTLMDTEQKPSMGCNIKWKKT